MTRQRKWQIKQTRHYKCTICGKSPTETRHLCSFHAEDKRKRQRIKNLEIPT